MNIDRFNLRAKVMTFQKGATMIAIIFVAIVISGCKSTINGEGDEESGTEYALNKTYDQTRNGVRLIMSYDVQSNSFIGTVENTTGNTLKNVRVEVHLSNGVELGPTTPADLAPGEKRDVTLTATSTSFNKWSPHAEVG